MLVAVVGIHRKHTRLPGIVALSSRLGLLGLNDGVDEAASLVEDFIVRAWGLRLALAGRTGSILASRSAPDHAFVSVLIPVDKHHVSLQPWQKRFGSFKIMRLIRRQMKAGRICSIAKFSLALVQQPTTRAA